MTQVPAGQALAFQLVAACSAVILVAVGTTSVSRWTAVALALAGAMAPALAGHSSLDGLHVEAAVSLCLHIAGVSVWVGGLAVVSALLLLEPERTSDLLPRFSVLALVCVVVVAESGLLNASLRAGTAEALAGSTYGSLVLAKAVLLAWLIRLGWLQRRRAVDRLRLPDVRSIRARSGRPARGRRARRHGHRSCRLCRDGCGSGRRPWSSRVWPR